MNELMKPKYLEVKDNIAYLDGHNLYDLAKEYKTPLIVYSEKELRDNINTFKDNFKSNTFNTHIVYASKAFFAPYLATILTDSNLYMDSVSLGDLYVAKESGFDMSHVVFHGNNKSNDELLFAIENNVLIVVDNIEELERLCTLAEEKRKTVHTQFRVNPGISAHTHKYIQTATFVSKFGESIFDVEKVKKLVELYRNSKYVILDGFHSHIGSQIQEKEPFLKNAEAMLKFTKMVSESFSYSLTSLNLGGGFGIPYVKDDIPLNKENTLEEMIKEIEKLNHELGLNLRDLYIEPGRSLLGNSCVTLYEIGAFKETYGKKNYLFVDGGMTDNIRPALYDAEYEVDVVNRMNDEKCVIADVAGKCCESGDIVKENAMLPKTNSGDILMVYATGAYTYAMSSNYNNHLKPCVLFITENNEPIVAARRETLEDLMKLFR